MGEQLGRRLNAVVPADTVCRTNPTECGSGHEVSLGVAKCHFWGHCPRSDRRMSHRIGGKGRVNDENLGRYNVRRAGSSLKGMRYYVPS